MVRNVDVANLKRSSERLPDGDDRSLGTLIFAALPDSELEPAVK
jgi:hypothetical protein